MKKLVTLFLILVGQVSYGADSAPLPRPLSEVKLSRVAQPPAKSSSKPADAIIAEGGYVDFSIEVPTGASVVWRISPAPIQRSTGLPPGRLVFGGKKGTTYTATAIIVDFDKKQVTDADYVFVFSGVPTTPPIKDPPVKDPPVKDPPVTEPTVYYFLVVRADGPAAPSFTKTMQDPAWATLKKAGHKVRDMSLTEATETNISLPPGSALPIVVILKGPTGSEILKAVPFPATSAAILDLPTKGASK